MTPPLIDDQAREIQILRAQRDSLRLHLHEMLENFANPKPEWYPGDMQEWDRVRFIAYRAAQALL